MDNLLESSPEKARNIIADIAKNPKISHFLPILKENGIDC
jgi:hypothetical protein